MSEPGNLRILPISAVVPTSNRSQVLDRTLNSLRAQGVVPVEMIIIDGSDNNETQQIAAAYSKNVGSGNCRVLWQQANPRGAAAQRNQGFAQATQPVVWFFDDDILFEPECVARLWSALQSDGGLGGVNAMITNQRYQAPGRVSRFMFRLMAGRRQASYAGMVLGPAVNLLPEDRDDLPDIVSVEWLNLGCTLYRREALPQPPFPIHFTGYSMMEDLTLSLTVAKRWRLANARTARIFHDSQPGSYKSDPAILAEMELVNRHYVMTQILLRSRWADFLRLAIWELFQISAAATNQGRRTTLHRVLLGKLKGMRRLVSAFR